MPTYSWRISRNPQAITDALRRICHGIRGFMINAANPMINHSLHFHKFMADCNIISKYKLYQGCLQHPRYKGGKLIDIEPKPSSNFLFYHTLSATWQGLWIWHFRVESPGLTIGVTWRSHAIFWFDYAWTLCYLCTARPTPLWNAKIID